MEYCLKSQFENGNHIQIETNDRNAFIQIERFVNELNIQNEEGFEFKNQIENELEFGIENQNENEPQFQIETKKQSQNELDLSKLTLTTNFGTVKLHNSGYLYVSSNKEGNINKLYHRLIYEEYHKVTLLPEAVIHHIDENKLNNHIDNLICMSRQDHTILHNQIAHADKDHTNMRISRNTTGFYGVYKQVCPKCSQGFTWKYTYKEQGILKTIESVDLKKLEAKVKAKNLIWREL